MTDAKSLALKVVASSLCLEFGWKGELFDWQAFDGIINNGGQLTGEGGR